VSSNKFRGNQFSSFGDNIRTDGFEFLIVHSFHAKSDCAKYKMYTFRHYSTME